MKAWTAFASLALAMMVPHAGAAARAGGATTPPVPAPSASAEKPSGPESGEAGSSAAERPPLRTLLEGVRKTHEIPALAAVATRADAVLEIDACGSRREGKPDQVTAQDLFHIGSNTKAMTATLAGILIEGGTLTWTTTTREAFSAWADDILPEYRDVTVVDLLSHRAGLASYEDEESPEFRDLKSLQGDPPAQRKEFAHRALRRKHAVPPRTKAQYSNGGYAVAAAMIQWAGKGLRSLMRSRLFDPLAAPSSAGRVRRPAAAGGRVETKRGVRSTPARLYQLPAVLASPAVSISAGDYARSSSSTCAVSRAVTVFSRPTRSSGSTRRRTGSSPSGGERSSSRAPRRASTPGARARSTRSWRCGPRGTSGSRSSRTPAGTGPRRRAARSSGRWRTGTTPASPRARGPRALDRPFSVPGRGRGGAS